MARYVRQIKPPGAKEGQSRIYAMTPELEKKIQDDPKGQEFKEVYGGFEDGKFIEKKRTISLGLKMEVEKEKKEPEPEPVASPKTGLDAILSKKQLEEWAKESLPDWKVDGRKSLDKLKEEAQIRLEGQEKE